MNISGSKASPKPRKGVADKAYVNWVTDIPSVIDAAFDRHESSIGTILKNDGHHIHTKGARGGDYWRIPLTRKQHQLCHAKGNKFVENENGLDFHKIVCKLLSSRFGFRIPTSPDWELLARDMVAKAEEIFRNE